jgi:hypothetical protein
LLLKRRSEEHDLPRRRELGSWKKFGKFYTLTS